MKDLFEHISDRIMAGAPVRMVDFDLGQLEQEPMPPLSYPAVLVAFDAPVYENLGAGAQHAQTTISLRCAFRVWERTHSKAESSFRDVGLAHLDAIAAIHTALSGTSGDNFSAITRLGFSNEQRADLRVYTILYTCTYYDVPDSPYQPWPDSVEDDDEGNPIPLPDPGFCVTPIFEI